MRRGSYTTGTTGTPGSYSAMNGNRPSSTSARFRTSAGTPPASNRSAYPSRVSTFNPAAANSFMSARAQTTNRTPTPVSQRNQTPRGRFHPMPTIAHELDDISSRAATAARHIRSSSPALGSDQPPPQQQQQPALRQDEIKRIVDKVTSHFAPQLDQLREENERLRAEVESLRSRQQQQQPQQQDHSAEIRELRDQLQREKRARFECEEQSHKMGAEHSKYVETMERRLRVAEQQAQTLSSARTPRSARLPPPPAAQQNQQQQQHQPVMPLSAGRSESRGRGAAHTPNNQVLSAASPLAPPAASAPIDESTNFFDQVSRQLDDINNREASRSAAIRQLL